MMSTRCVFEVAVLFLAIAALLLLWTLACRPTLCISALYLAICFAILIRETLLTVTGHVPCGLPTFGSECAETQCQQKSYFLFFETGCAKHLCVRTERLEVQSVFKVPASELHTVWLITGLAFAWATLLLTAFQLKQWMTPVFGGLPAERGHSIARLTAIVLLLPATYGVCAAGALRVITTNREDTWTAEALLDVAELFSAIALYSFQRLLIVYVDVLHADSPKADVKVEPDQIRHSFQKVMSVGIQQYVVLQFVCNSILVAVKAWDWLHPSSCEDALQGMMQYVFPRHNISLAINEAKLRDTIHTRTSSLACEDVWNATSLLMVVADFFTCSIALFAVLQYEHAFNDALRPVRPFWKFWGVKGLLSVNFMQTSVLTALGFLLASETPSYVRTFLNYYLLSAESLALALLNLWAYPVKHPRPAREKVDFVDELQDDESSRTARPPLEIEAPAPSAETLGRKQSA